MHKKEIDRLDALIEKARELGGDWRVLSQEERDEYMRLVAKWRAANNPNHGRKVRDTELGDSNE